MTPAPSGERDYVVAEQVGSSATEGFALMPHDSFAAPLYDIIQGIRAWVPDVVFAQLEIQIDPAWGPWLVVTRIGRPRMPGVVTPVVTVEAARTKAAGAPA